MAATPDIRSYRIPPHVRQDLLDRAAAVVARHPEILFCYAHGSFLRDGPFRDPDPAEYLDGTPPASRFLYEDALGLELVEGLRPDFPVDVRILNGAPLAFQFHACRGKLLADRAPDRRAAIMAYIASRYLDIKPILEHHAREAFGDGPGS